MGLFSAFSSKKDKGTARSESFNFSLEEEILDMEEEEEAKEAPKPDPFSGSASKNSEQVKKIAIIAAASIAAIIVIAGAVNFFLSDDGEKEKTYLEDESNSPRIVLNMPPRRAIKRKTKNLIKPPEDKEPENTDGKDKTLQDINKKTDDKTEKQPDDKKEPEQKQATEKTEPEKVPEEPEEEEFDTGPLDTATKNIEVGMPKLIETAITPIAVGDLLKTMPSFYSLRVPEQNENPSLSEAPDEELQQKTGLGFLPKIDSKGRKPWQVYSRPFNGDQTKPRISIIIMGLGLYEQATQVAIGVMPPEFSLSFSPYSTKLEEDIKSAREWGHEVLIDLPMESKSFPAMDSGPLTLLTLLSKGENIIRLETILSKATGYIGLTGYMGSKFLNSPISLRPIMKNLKKRGLLFVDTSKSTGIDANRDVRLAHATADLFIDEKKFRASIDARLKYLEDLARYRGHAIGIANVFPVTFHALNDWAKEFAIPDSEYDEKYGEGASKDRVLLVPISSIVTE